MPLDIRPGHLKIVEEILEKYVPDREVWAFGSRTTGRARDTSDLDLAVIGETPLDFQTLGDLRDAFSESNIPYKVDVVDWANIGETFKNIIRKDKVVIKRKSESEPDNRFKMVRTKSTGVAYMALKDLLTMTKDGEWGKGEPLPDHQEMLIVRGTDFIKVRLGSLSEVPTRYIPNQIAVRKKLEDLDILIETAGGTKDQPTGRTVFLKDRLLRSARLPLTCSSFARFLRVNPKLANPEYIFWYLQFLYRTGEMEKHQVQHTGVARFQFTKFSNATFVPLPSLNEQRAIAHILGTLDDKIELNRRMNETLEAMARAIFKSWFVDFDPVRAKMEGRPTGLPKEIEDLFPDSFEDSELGEIPRGWRVGKLGDVATNPRRSKRPFQVGKETPYIALEHMPKRCLALTEWGTTDGIASNKFEFKNGEILFGKLRPYFHKVGIAPLDGVCSTDIFVVNSRSGKWFGFVLGHVSSTSLVEHTNTGSTGTRMPRTSWKEMSDYAIVVPPEIVSEVFTQQIQPAVNHMIATIHESHNLTTLRDTLLPKLLSGEIRVKEAEKFLERAL